MPKPPARATLMALFTDIQAAVDAVTGLIRRRVVPATLELIDRESLQAVSAHIGREVAPAGTGAMLIVEADGAQSAVDEEIDRVTESCREAGASRAGLAVDDEERDRLWTARRLISMALRATGLLKINHDVVVPRGRVPNCLQLSTTSGSNMACGSSRSVTLATATFT